MKFVGLGFRSGASAASVLDALERAGGTGLRRLAVPADKLADPLIGELKTMGFDIVPIPCATLAGIDTPTQSAISLQIYGTGSVAEACALAAGPAVRLLGARVVSVDRMATAALARTGEEP